MKELSDKQYEDEKQAIKKLNYQRYNWYNSEKSLMNLYIVILKNVIIFNVYFIIYGRRMYIHVQRMYECIDMGQNKYLCMHETFDAMFIGPWVLNIK